MGINGPAFARVARRVRQFLSGKTPNTLVAVKGGEVVPFVHESEMWDLTEVDDGSRADTDLQVFVGVRLAEGSLWIYNAKTWRAVACEFDRAAGSDWPHKVTLWRQEASP